MARKLIWDKEVLAQIDEVATYNLKRIPMSERCIRI